MNVIKGYGQLYKFSLTVRGDFGLHVVCRNDTKKDYPVYQEFSYKGELITSDIIELDVIKAILSDFSKMKRVEPNDYFKKVERTQDGEVYHALYCKFITNEKVYLDYYTVRAMLRAFERINLGLSYAKFDKIGNSKFISNAMDKNSEEMRWFNERVKMVPLLKDIKSKVDESF